MQPISTSRVISDNHLHFALQHLVDLHVVNQELLGPSQEGGTAILDVLAESVAVGPKAEAGCIQAVVRYQQIVGEAQHVGVLYDDCPSLFRWRYLVLLVLRQAENKSLRITDAVLVLGNAPADVPSQLFVEGSVDEHQQRISFFYGFVVAHCVVLLGSPVYQVELLAAEALRADKIAQQRDLLLLNADGLHVE